MKQITFFVSDSEIAAIGDIPDDLGLGVCTKRRASNVIPTRPWARRLFFWLRSTLGMRLGGALSRRLPGPWMATILETGHHCVFNSRARAIQWEIKQLEELLSR